MAAEKNGETPIQERETTMEERADQAYRLFIFSLSDHVTAMIDHLVRRKQLPPFYFHEAARACGIDQKTYRNWRVREWPGAPMRKESRIQDIGQTLLLVEQRLVRYPYNESYWEAIRRLQQRIRDLKAAGLSRNSLTQLMNLPNGSIDRILLMDDHKDGRRYNHCPWILLEKLEEAESRIQEQSDLETFFKSNRAEARREEPEPVSPPEGHPERYWARLESLIVPVRGNCLKCKMPWTHLIYEGPVQGAELHLFSCITCAQTNIVRTPVIERHSRCGSCGNSWWNLKLREKTPDGCGVIICPNCGMRNLVPPKGVPAAGYKKMHGIVEDIPLEGNGEDSDAYERAMFGGTELEE